MALLVTQTETSKLTIKGTTTELPTAYLRLEMAFSFDGLLMAGRSYFFESRALYDLEKTVLEIKELKQFEQQKQFPVDVATGESQNVLLFHQKIKTELENAGYIVEIIELT